MDKTRRTSEHIPQGDRLMMLQGYTRAFFMWVLKDREPDDLYKIFVELLQEYMELDIPHKAFIVFVEMGLEDELITEDDVERLREAVLKNDIPLYQWLVQHLKA
ncbi:hypothetical protein [Chryseosolibacter indicus]|uniref:FAD assembly factor SdhE n=1 Tax=Chryseosolibacter indicus TaxID=2782351 RepID=A0ABS5VUM0_9BACT|nr:hypothetical protein [Chryseosolibacter indicus]MBT1705130.1 hypothetical protein [Chryseosolibacter indicus]